MKLIQQPGEKKIHSRHHPKPSSMWMEKMYNPYAMVCYGKCITLMKDGPSVIKFLKSVYYIQLVTIIQLLKVLIFLAPQISVL